MLLSGHETILPGSLTGGVWHRAGRQVHGEPGENLGNPHPVSSCIGYHGHRACSVALVKCAAHRHVKRSSLSALERDSRGAGEPIARRASGHVGCSDDRGTDWLEPQPAIASTRAATARVEPKSFLPTSGDGTAADRGLGRSPFRPEQRLDPVRAPDHRGRGHARDGNGATPRSKQ